MAIAARPRRTPLWLHKDPVLDKAGKVVKGGMWAPQREWWNLKSFVRAYVAGYGAGKTLIGCKRGIALAIHNAPAPHIMVSPTYPMARETTIVTLMELLEGKASLLPGFRWSYTQNSGFRIHYRGRHARILIRTGENPKGLRGPNVGSASIDEPFLQPVEVFIQMHARVRHPSAKQKEIDLLGTPEQLNWGYDLVTGELDGYTDVDVGVVTASTRSNLAVGQDYADRLEGAMDAKTAQAYVGGQFVNLSKGQVYYGFDPMENVVDLPVPDGVELGVGMDFNVNPMSAAVFFRKGSHIHFFDEIELPNADTEYMCSMLAEKYGKRGLVNIYPDASGKARATNAPGGASDFTYIEKAGFEVNANKANPARKDRYNAVNGKLKPASGRITLTVSPKCKKLRKYMVVYSHELLNTTEQKAMSHLLDAMSYAVAYLFPVNPKELKVQRLGGY